MHQTATTAPAARDPSTGAPIVLVVDDDAMTRRFFTTALTRAGFDALAAQNGSEALRLAADRNVSVVLLDSRMPGMDGIEVLAALRKKPGGRTLPVIFVTGANDIDDRVRGLEAGAVDYLVKPVALDELVARVRAQIRSRDAWTSTIDDLERRVESVRLLRRIRRSDSAEATASEVCTELLALEEIDGAAILLIHGARSVVPLAVHGILDGALRAGEPLDESVTPDLIRRLRRGPWLETAGLGDLRRPATMFSLGLPGPVALAPLAGRHRNVGALLLARGGDSGPMPHMLSTAIDFASAVSVLIAPELQREEELEDARRAASERFTSGAFVPFYQPVMDLTRDTMVGFEALTRWNDGTRADIPFAQAAALGIGAEMECITLARQTESAKALPPGLWLSVNVSAALVLSGAAVDIARGAGRPMVLELTEHEPIDDYDLLQDALGKFAGIRVAVDDAGAGYSSMRHVLALRPDLVKIDSTWVRGVDADPARRALVSAMTDFARELGCTLVAEGIETPEELATLRQLGITLGQGFLLGHPAPASSWH